MLAWIKSLHISTKLMVLVILTNLADFITTSILVGRGGYGIEANLVLYHMMVHFDSVWVIFWVKTLAILIVWGLIRYFINHPSLRPTYLIIPLILVIFVVGGVSIASTYVIYTT